MAATRHRLPKPPPAPVHPIVEIDYRVRTWANLLVLAVIGSVFLERESPAWYWLLLAFQGVGWAPLARVRAQRATDSKRAEHQNLLADAVIYGVLSGLVSFSLWPTTLMLASILLSVLSLGGPQLAARAAVAFVPGALLGSALGGFSLQFESSLRTSLLCVVCFVPYLLMFGMNSFVQNQRAQRARHELAQRNEQVTRQNRELELARMLAESANRTKSAFLANMSHELRTPLNAIIGYSEMLEADALDEGQHAKAQDLGKIRSAGAGLLAMVEDVLNLSRLEAGQTYLASNPIRPGEMVRAVANTVREQIENNGNAFRIDCDMGTPCVMGDEGKLRQILSHLLSNAGKFTRAGVGQQVRHADAGAAGVGHRRGHCAGAARAPVPPLLAGRRFEHAALRRQRHGPGHCAALLRPDGRLDRRAERARRGRLLHRAHSRAAGQPRAPGGGRGAEQGDGPCLGPHASCSWKTTR